MDQYWYQAYFGLYMDKAVTTLSGRNRGWHICDSMSSVPATAHAKGLHPATADKQRDQQQGSDDGADGYL